MNTQGRQNVGFSVLLWAVGNSAAGAVIGLAVGLFKQGGLEMPTLVISVLFGNVVGFTAMICSSVVFPRLRGLPPGLRFVLLALALLSGSVVGSIAVLYAYPLFVFRQPRLAVSVVTINGVVGLIVGGIVYGYESMGLRLQESLREIREVRLVEARLREEAAQAELAALQARINPHFFFNTLNTITSLIEDDPDEAAEVCQKLGDLFRYTFKVSDAGPVPLGEEIAFIRGYLEIERARFGERLRVEWRLDPAALDAEVPGLIFQPLVENAVVHGVAPLARGGLLAISAGLDGPRLSLEVRDDGAGLEGETSALIHDGHGLGNVRRRLETFYGAAASLELLPGAGGRGALARVVLPRRRSARSDALEPEDPS